MTDTAPPTQSDQQQANGTEKDGKQGRREKRQPSVARPARLAEVVTVAILDTAGVLVTIAAALILTIDDSADQRWWAAVGLASLLAVFTTVFLIRMMNGRRTFIEASRHLADRLEEQHPTEVTERLRNLARARRDAAEESGDLAIADKLTVVLEGLR
jgi:hypothetical protein